jgi:hypothetical protein
MVLYSTVLLLINATLQDQYLISCLSRIVGIIGLQSLEGLLVVLSPAY